MVSVTLYGFDVPARNTAKPLSNIQNDDLPMSRLDSFIRRMRAQRACLNRAAELIRDVPGPVLELGLGNGRTYDHLREIMPEREIYVFDRQLAAHADCIPPREFLILGDGRDTLPMMRSKIPHSAALAHVDIGTGDVRENQRLAAELVRLIAPLMRTNAVVVSDPAVDLPGWHRLPLPSGVREGRYHLYRLRLAANLGLASPSPGRACFQSPCDSEKGSCRLGRPAIYRDLFSLLND